MKFLLPIGFSLLMGAAVYGQNPPQTPVEQHDDAQAVTVMGCLTKDASTGNYVITNAKTGEKLMFAGPDQLQTYVNHTVQMTGSMMSQGGEKAFRPQTVKTISDSCESSQR
jgi:hypothetical protein